MDAPCFHLEEIESCGWVKLFAQRGDPAGMHLMKKGENEMRKYKSSGELTSVVCNCCGKKLVVEGGILREGAIQICHTWDFFSEKDGEIQRFDLCEDCYDNLVNQFRIEPEVEEQVEFI